MRRIVIVLLMISLITVPAPAYAEEVVLEGFATFNFPSTVKLRKTGCQEIKINYVTDEDLPRENSVMIVAITPVNSRRAHGYAAWLSTLTYMGDDALPPMARLGVLPVKVCRKAWQYSEKATRLTPAVTAGTYQIIFGGSFYDAVTGEMKEGKIEISRKIKFTK
jgi:hypothetical protein